MAPSAILDKTSLKIQHVCQGGHSGLRLRAPPFCGGGRMGGGRSGRQARQFREEGTNSTKATTQCWPNHSLPCCSGWGDKSVWRGDRLSGVLVTYKGKALVRPETVSAFHPILQKAANYTTLSGHQGESAKKVHSEWWQFQNKTSQTYHYWGSLRLEVNGKLASLVSQLGTVTDKQNLRRHLHENSLTSILNKLTPMTKKIHVAMASVFQRHSGYTRRQRPKWVWVLFLASALCKPGNSSVRYVLPTDDPGRSWLQLIRSISGIQRMTPPCLPVQPKSEKRRIQHIHNTSSWAQNVAAILCCGLLGSPSFSLPVAKLNGQPTLRGFMGGSFGDRKREGEHTSFSQCVMSVSDPRSFFLAPRLTLGETPGRAPATNRAANLSHPTVVVVVCALFVQNWSMRLG